MVAPARDRDLAAVLRRGLEPNGVRVVTLPPAAVEAFCGQERPGVLILEWPLPPELGVDSLARIRSGPGAPAGVLLLADESREAVSGVAPELLHLIDMFFRKPVAWEHFFRVLARHLGLPEIAGFKADAPRPLPPAARTPAEDDGLRAEFQRQMEARFLEVEELKRRLHRFESDPRPAPDPVPAPAAIEALEAEAARHRALAAEAEAAGADAIAKAAVLEEALARAEEAQGRQAAQLAHEQKLREQGAAELCRALERADRADRRIDELLAQRAELEGQAIGAVAGRRSAEAALAEASACRAELERKLAGAREAQSGAVQELRERAAEAREALEGAERRCEQLQASFTALEERARDGEAARVSIAAEAEAAVADIGQRLASLERELNGERQARVAAGRAAAEAAAERDRLSQSLQEREAAHAAEVGLWRDQAGSAADRRLEAESRLESAQAHARSLEERLAAAAARESGAELFRGELRRIQELLEEVIDRARNDAVSHARSEAELGARLEAALEERRLLQERIERGQAEAAERERRSSALLQSAIERSPARPQERANLPALLPPERGPRISRRTAGLAGLAAATVLVVLALSGLRRLAPPAGRDAGPEVSVPARPAAGVGGPNEIWDRWTRSDSSGGVLVQATLRSAQELRAEVESERGARGWTEAEARAELERRLAGYGFEGTYYVSLYLKHLAPGLPGYLDNLAGRFHLRSGAGRETPAFIPPGHEKSRRIFSFGSGPPAERIYEATVMLGFDRSALEGEPSYLQLVVSDVGSTSRRVLTWELE